MAKAEIDLAISGWTLVSLVRPCKPLELPYVVGHIPDGLGAAIIEMFAAQNSCTGEPGYDEADDTVTEISVKIWFQYSLRELIFDWQY